MRVESENTQAAYLFGTFNPFHTGHLALAQAALKLPFIEAVSIIPTGKPPHRQNDPSLIPIKHRLAMACLAITHQASMTVLEHEASTEQVSYTAKTLQRLHGQDPKTPIYVILGQDAYETLSTWQQADWLQTHVHFLVAKRRSGFDVLPSHRLTSTSITWLETPVHSASATAIRTAFKENLPIPEDWLHPEVASYITTHHLYET